MKIDAGQSVEHRRLRLRVLEPAVFPDRPGGGNSASTLEFVPGTALRGALAQRFLRRVGSPDDTFNTLFEGGLRFLDGRIVHDDVRSTPVPASFRKCKNCGLAQRKDLVGPDQARTACVGCGGSFTAVRGWWTGGSEFPAVRTVFRGKTAMNNGTAEEGSLRFAAALDCGQVFEARIVGPGGRIDQLLNLLDLGCGTRLRMGAAASVGGRFEVDGKIERVHPTLPTEIHADGLVAVDLVSRAVLVDPFLRAVTLPEPPAGWRLADRGRQPWAYTALDEVHGWNAGQQLPKPVDLAVTAGSVVVLERDTGDVAASVDSLQAWLDHGIGLRRSEGFGEVSFRIAVDGAGEQITAPAPLGLGG